MFFLSFLLFAAAEIAAFVVVAEHIGFLWALALLIAVSATGPFVIRRVGFSVLAHTRGRLEEGQLPTRELLDGLVMFVGGAMICVPGFISDALGLLLMLRPVRHLVVRFSGHQIARKVQGSGVLRWHVIDVRSRPGTGGFVQRSEPTDRSDDLGQLPRGW